MRMLLALLVAIFCAQARAQLVSTNDTAVRFRAVDVFVDSKNIPLGAYQLEFTATRGDVKIVGIEGGEHPAFAVPPFYDPKAMQHERVILAAFSTNAVSQLPVGKTRVATIHLLTSAEQPEYELKLQVAADADGNRITAQTSLEERKTQ